MADNPHYTFTITRFLLLLAILCFVLAAFSVSLPLEIVPVGLAFLAASFLL